ncbi:MAG: MarR family transcriptional regulator [Planctomycetes bacterium]|nr:MarR family transcriptional regulator [Planctomycetota bacterium]
MNAPMRFTERQGEMLAFIHRFTAKHGVAPSFEEIASHFGTSSPSVNGMIKTLVRRGLLSRVPGVARSLRVLVPASLLPNSEFGSAIGRREGSRQAYNEAPSLTDVAFAVAVSVVDVFKEGLGRASDASDLVLKAASAVYDSLLKIGMTKEEAREAARCVAAEAARCQPDGRGISVRRRRWTKL